MKLIVEHWWNDIYRGNTKYSDRNVFQCHFVNLNPLAPEFSLKF